MSKFAGIILGGAEIAAGLALNLFTAGTAGTFLILAGAGQVIGGLGSLLNQPQGGLLTASRNPVMPWNVVYGRAKVGGTLVYINESGENDKYLDLVFVLACHPCQSVDALLFDNQRVLIGANGNSVRPTSLTGTDHQQTVPIASIARSNGVVTVVLSSAFTIGLQDGDRILIKSVSGQAANDRSMNGTFFIQVVNATTFTYLNGGLNVSLGATGQAQTAFPDYREKVHMEVLLGNQTSTFPGMLNGTPYDAGGSTVTVAGNPWTASCLLSGRTAVFLRLHYNDEVFSNGLPQISFRVSGKNDIYDPRTGTRGYTENAALCIADYLSNTTFGFKANYGTEIPADRLSTAAGICDEAITLASGGTEPRYALNGQVALTSRRGEILQNMLTACGGRITYSGGQFVIWPAAWYGTNATYRQDGSANFGGDSSLYVQGDWSAGLWLKLPANAHGSLLAMVDAGVTDPTAAAPYALAVTGGPGTFGVEYVHDYGSSSGLAGHEYLPFAAAIPADTWTYVGVSRNSAAKTVTLFTSDGTTIQTIGTQSYSNTPGISPGLAQFTLGEFYYGSFAGTPANNLFYPAISVIASAYVWSSNLSGAQHLAAAQGSAPSSNLVFAVSNAGNSPLANEAGSHQTATITGTAVVDGPSSANAARQFGLTSGTSSTIGVNNLAGPIRWRPKVPIRDLYNGVKGTFISPYNGWQNSDYPPYAQDATHGYSGPGSYEGDANLAADGGDRRWFEMQLPFTISSSTCQRLAKVQLLRLRQQGAGTLVFNAALYHLTALDIIQMTIPYLGWSNKLLEIASHRLTLNKQQPEGGAEVVALGCEIDVQETDPSIYVWNATEELTPQGFQQAAIPGTTQPAAPTGISLASNASTASTASTGIATSRIQVSWTAPADGYVTNGGSVEVQYAVAGTSNYVSLGKFDPSVTSAYINGVTDGTSYDVQIRSVSASGVPSDWVDAGNVTAAGSSVPAQPYDVVCYVPGQPLASEELLKFVVPAGLANGISFGANFANSNGNVDANPAATFACTVFKRLAGSTTNAQVGTITISTAGVFTFANTGALSLAAGDTLLVTAPSAQDASIQAISFTLAGTR